MIREVILLPTDQVSQTRSGGAQTSRDPGSSPYPGSNTPTYTLAECWSDEDDESFWYMHPNKTTGGLAVVLASFAAPPTLVLIRSVKLQMWWSYQQQGPNNWYFPPANAFAPRFRLALRNRAKDGNLYSDYETIDGDEIVDQFENINTGSPSTYDGPKLYEWEMDAHPEGGPWTLDDLSVANFAAGVEASASNPAFTTAQGSMAKLRVHKVQATLTVEDLGGYVENVRHAASLALRLMHRARNTVTLRSLADKAVGEVGSRVYMSHPHGPSVATTGWGRRRLERRPGLILKRTIDPESFKVEDQAFDLQVYSCLAWAAYRIDGPWSPELQGLAFLEKGGGFTHTRDQDGWSSRPGDGVLMRVIDDYPNLCTRGLAAQGGGDVAVCLRNYDLMQDGWSTVGSAGTFEASADTTVTMVEEQGYLSSCALAYGFLGGAGGQERELGALAAGRLHVRVILKNTSVPDPETQFGEWYLRRGTDYWNEATRTWDSSPAYNAIPSDAPYGEVVADSIPATAATYHVGVGRFSSQMGPVTLHGALVDVQHSDDTVAGARTPLVTLDATITREPDVHRLANDPGASAEIWSYTRGVAVVEAQPFWRAADLPDDAVKPLLHAYYAADTWDALQFVAQTGADDVVRFERAVAGQATYQLDCPVESVDLTRAHVLRAWARWLGADGWAEYGPYSVEVGYAVFLEADGSLVASGSVVGRLAYEGNVAARAWVGVGNDNAVEGGRYADAYVRLLEVRRNPISGLEATWRV